MIFHKTTRLILLVASALMLVGCSDRDEFSPSIVTILINGESLENQNAIAGELNTLQVEVSDDVSLKQLKVELNTQSGVHQHESQPGELPHPFLIYNQGSWDTLSIHNIAGQSAISMFDLNIPDSVSGGWSLIVTVLDEEGNLTMQEETLRIQNVRFPLISVGATSPSPVSDGYFLSEVGSAFTIAGLVTDPDSLADVRIARFFDNAIDFELSQSDIGDISFDLSQPDLPFFNESGTYEIHIYATDLLGFTSHAKATVSVE